MDVTQKIHVKLEKILLRLKVLKIIQTFKLEINFCKIENSLITNLVEIDSILRKCLRKIIAKPKKAEIRNVISELVRKKNLNDKILQSEGNFREKRGFVCEKDFEKNTRKNHCEEFNQSKGLYINNEAQGLGTNYLCEICGESYHNSQKWNNHTKSHQNDFNFNCENCHLTLSSPTDFQTHCKTHEKNQVDSLSSLFSKPVKGLKTNVLNFPIERVNDTESDKSKLGVDLKNEKSSPVNQSFTCQCGKIFRLLKTFKKHKSIKHSSSDRFHICDVCGKTFLEKGKLNRHMLSHKNAEYECSFCLRKFARSDALKRHCLIAHSIQKKFSCTFCHKRFSLKYNKDIHEETIHKNLNNWIQCDICTQKLKNKITFKGHIKMHLKH